MHAKKVSDLASLLASHTGFFSFLCQIFQTNCLCVLIPSIFLLKTCLPLPLHLICSLKNYQLIPLCQTKSLPSVLILFDLHADHPFLQSSSLGWYFCLGFLPLPPYFDLKLENFPKCSFFFSLIIFTAVCFTSLQELSLTFHLRVSPISLYLYQHNQVLVLKLLFLISFLFYWHLCCFTHLDSKSWKSALPFYGMQGSIVVKSIHRSGADCLESNPGSMTC